MWENEKLKNHQVIACKLRKLWKLQSLTIIGDTVRTVEKAIESKREELDIPCVWGGGDDGSDNYQNLGGNWETCW